MKITFLGAVEQVTGSKYLIEDQQTKILVDCGLFQEHALSSKRNYEPFFIEPSRISAIILTHAHVDHSGYIPALVKHGFRGKIYCSPATYALCSILLLDSGALQEQEAARESQDRYFHHYFKFPLYTKAEAEHALQFFQVVEYDTPIHLGDSLTATLIRSGHILGSSFVVISDGSRTLTFSGDLGRPNQLIMKAPTHLTTTDYLVIESTYGDRIHEKRDPLKELADAISSTASRGGVVVIPVFAVGRAQTMLYYLYQLKQKHMIPDIPVYLDSPMAIKVTELFSEFLGEHKLSLQECNEIFNVAQFTRTAQQSKMINNVNSPAIILAGSGMADGGRVIYHFQHFIADAQNTVIFVGFQAEGTLGHELVHGAKEIDLYGHGYPVHATIQHIDAFSAHADSQEILEWLSYFKNAPTTVFVTHGTVVAAQALQEKIKQKFGWSVVVPKYSDSYDLK